MELKRKDGIRIYDESGFAGMRKAGKLAAECLDYITPYVKLGVSTGELDDLCREFIISHGAIPACLGYHGYPKTICTSINHEICHGIPSYERKLGNGDIVNVDVTVILDGWYGDTSRMFITGKPSIKAKRLCDVTYECMMRGIEVVKPGAHFGDIGVVIAEYAHKYGYSVVDMFCGHGLGKVFHDAPNVMHTKQKDKDGNIVLGPVMEEGMFFTIEPMINTGVPDGLILSEEKHGYITKWPNCEIFPAITKGYKNLSAQYEHSLGVTKDGFEIFTLSPKGFDRYPYKVD